MKVKSKTKNKILIALSILIAITALIGFWETNEKRKINSSGIVVVAEVVYVPESCSKINYRLMHVKLKYKDKIFIKDVDLELCEIISGEKKIKMLTNKKGSQLLFKEEYEEGDFVFSFLLLILSSIGIRQGLKDWLWKNTEKRD